MAWPQATDFSAAIQNPSQSFRDSELLRGQPATDPLLGLPLMYSGNFASVFKVLCPGDQAWAVKCFTRPVADLQDRYQRISDHLDRQRRKFAVEFVYLPEGIAVKGAWYPVLKMRWVAGFTLNEFLRDHADQPALLDQLGLLWLRLAGELREARMAHGDLQHGNVMLVPGSKSTSLALRLIDYDGLWIPDLAAKPPGEVGHPNYQHPERLVTGGYSAEIDRFSHLVIFTAFRALMAGGKALWDRYDNGENLLFRAADFSRPGKSKLLGDLFALPGNDLRALVGHLVDASQQPLENLPLLTEIVDKSQVRRLSAEQADRLRHCLPSILWPRPMVAAMPSRSAPASQWFEERNVEVPPPTREAKVAPTVLLPPLLPPLPPPIKRTILESVESNPFDALPAGPTAKSKPRLDISDRLRRQRGKVEAFTLALWQSISDRLGVRWRMLKMFTIALGLGSVVIWPLLIWILMRNPSRIDQEKKQTVGIGQGKTNTLDPRIPPHKIEPKKDPPGFEPSPKEPPPKESIVKEWPKEITNSIGMKLVQIPAGEFMMGSPEGEGFIDERPRHKVKITKPFHLGIHEVTQGQFEKVMGYNPSYFSRNGKKKAGAGEMYFFTLPAGGKDKLNATDDPDKFPVENVSYEDAVEFCVKLSALASEMEEKYLYRLPTEAEWEYACRGGASSYKKFHVGDTLTSTDANFDVNVKRTSTVGSYKKPNKFGLHDMHGNVAEWCSDRYGPYSKDDQVNPTGLSKGSHRVIRGGSWGWSAERCSAGSRIQNFSASRVSHSGFRVALIPSQRDGVIEPKAEVKKDPPDKPDVPKKGDAITNSIGMKLAYIPAGTFMMGSRENEGDASERPRHKVKITKAFYLGIHEVTQGQFKKVMGYNPSYFSRDGTKKPGTTYVFDPAGGKAKIGEKDDPDDHPVENVSWEEATEYCKKLSALAKEKEKTHLYRLPTEAEWEYSCRGGPVQYKKFHFGDELTSDDANCNSKLGRTSVVGSYKANVFGLHDMHGNVWEWCSDRYGNYSKDDKENSTGPAVGSDRVIRGGSWLNLGWSCRSAARYRYSPTVRYQYYGFRVALVPSQ